MHQISWHIGHFTVSGLWSLGTQQQPQCSLETTWVNLCTWRVTCKTLWIKVSIRINYMLYFGLVCTRHLAVVQTQGAWPFGFSWRNSVSRFLSHTRFSFRLSHIRMCNMQWPGKILHMDKFGHFLLCEVMNSSDFPGLNYLSFAHISSKTKQNVDIILNEFFLSCIW